MTADRPCKDCVTEGITTKRPAIWPGPRCQTHHRKIVKVRRVRAHARRTEATYGLSGDDYWRLYEAQGRRCYICQRATGAARRLAVDHDHRCAEGHPRDQGCPRCVRALLCGPCNQLLGRYGEESLKRAIEVLRDPPAQRTLLDT